MLTHFSILFPGLFLGMGHATDADHVVAVTNFVAGKSSVRRAVAIGSMWGLGHTLAIVIAGGAVVLFGLVISPRIGLSLEFGVALMLIVIGLMNLGSFVHWMRTHLGAPFAVTAGIVTSDPETAWLEGRPSSFGSGVVRPLVVGIIHGLAGSAALALLIVPMIQDPILAMVYLVTFGLGSIAGMMVITAAIAWPCARLGEKSYHCGEGLSTMAGVLSVSLGLFLAYEIGFVQGLLLP